MLSCKQAGKGQGQEVLQGREQGQAETGREEKGCEVRGGERCAQRAQKIAKNQDAP